MDTNTVSIISGIGGGLVGAPVGYIIERVFNRPRLKIAYAHAGYEDIITLSLNVQQHILRYLEFVQFVAGQVKWAFQQRLVGNMFTREELRLVYDLSIRYLDQQKQMWEVVQGKFSMVTVSKIDSQFLSEYETDYKQQFNSELRSDYKTSPNETVERLKDWYENIMTSRWKLVFGWLEDFVNEVKNSLGKKTGSSDKIVIRIGVVNKGFQDGIVGAESVLDADGRHFRLPIHTAYRPWETEGDSPQNYIIIKSKSLQVLEYVVDENLNARADIDKLREDLKRGLNVTLCVFGDGNRCAAKRTFFATLPY